MRWYNSWQFFAVLSALFAGLTALFGKIGVTNVNSNFATFIRVVVIFALTLLVVLAANQWHSPKDMTMKTWAFLILSGISTALSWLCYYRALQLGPISKVASLDKLSVVFAIFLGILLLGERISWQILLGGGLITAGAIVISMFG